MLSDLFTSLFNQSASQLVYTLIIAIIVVITCVILLIKKRKKENITPQKIVEIFKNEIKNIIDQVLEEQGLPSFLTYDSFKNEVITIVSNKLEQLFKESNLLDTSLVTNELISQIIYIIGDLTDIDSKIESKYNQLIDAWNKDQEELENETSKFNKSVGIYSNTIIGLHDDEYDEYNKN